MVVSAALAVLTGPRDKRDIQVRKGAAVRDLVNPHPEVTAQPVTIVFPEGHVVLSHTGHHAGPATRAFVQVNYHTELVSLLVCSMMFVCFVMYLFHGYPFLMIRRVSVWLERPKRRTGR